MAEDKNLDLLDLEDDAGTLPDFPESDPFCHPRPKRPWLLFGLGILVVILATYIIISVIKSGDDDSVDISLDTPVVEQGADEAPANEFTSGADRLILGADERPAVAAPVVAAPSAPVAVGTPTRTVEARRNVTFNPDATPAVEAPKPRPIAKPEVAKPKPVQKSSAAKPVAGGWSVQFASLSTRTAAEKEADRMKRVHPGLFAGKEFVILAAQLANGQTTYRVRVSGFKNSNDASGFCRNAKSDGLDCYVVKQ